MNRDTLQELLKCQSMKFKLEEIEKILEEELNKSPEEMDTELVDICTDVLEKVFADIIEEKSVKNEKKHIRMFSIKRIALIAAVVAVLSTATLTVFAEFLDFNIPQIISELIQGNAKTDMNLENADTSADEYALVNTALVKEFSSNGITPITLPEVFTDTKCKISDIQYTKNDVESNVVFDFESESYVGSTIINQYSSEYSFLGEEMILDVKTGHIVQANGMDILVFENNNSCTIRYRDNMTDYIINLECNIDQALYLAKTIK
ncbi:MAG: hypothetical protein NC122_08660 [Faecalibacterium sp.]|nr:hypothetical protein [Ruminococcus sp.]MCM1392381.1 hypothetical protein [Ruminococcus sp.]MCM1486265.1 hypothetical protein [Faecalibacterium sp.]